MQADRPFQCAVALTIAAMILASQPASAQSSYGNQLRPTGGWQASVPSGQAGEAPRAAAVQRAFFQSQPSGLPSLPTGFGSPANGGAIGGELPSFPPGMGGGPVPASPSPASSSGMNAPPVLPPSYTQTPAPVASPTSSQRSAPAQRNVPAQPAAYQNELRAQNTASAGQPASGQRPIQSAPAPGTDPRLAADSIATGLPYVTPPPRSRYPTSPYRGPVYQPLYAPALYVSAAPQGSVPARLASTGGASGAVPQGPAAQVPTGNIAALPQYQQPGIYPTAYQCAPPAPSFPSTGAVPGSYVPPTLTPNLTPGLYTPNNAGYTPLFSLGQENYNVMLGRGIIGQPTVYVAGQPIRNFMRYLSP